MQSDFDKSTILIVDDEPVNIDILAGILEDQYEILVTTDGIDALRIAEESLPDLIILDIIMPGMDGYEVCTSLKNNPDTANIPVIFVSALTGTQEETKGLSVGAIDYITKPISPPIVKMRVANHIKLIKAMMLLEKLSTTDSLTSLANRRLLDLTIKHELNRLKRKKEPISLIMLDIDHFKEFNDAYGHPAGDECLKQISFVISQVCRRPQDLAARYGGEEFCCVLPEMKKNKAMEIAENIRKKIISLYIPNNDSSVNEYVTASLGVITIIANGQITSDELIELADKKLYEAKKSGRNKVV